mgnify:CR=1 FL=1
MIENGSMSLTLMTKHALDFFGSQLRIGDFNGEDRTSNNAILWTILVQPIYQLPLGLLIPEIVFSLKSHLRSLIFRRADDVAQIGKVHQLRLSRKRINEIDGVWCQCRRTRTGVSRMTAWMNGSGIERQRHACKDGKRHAC